MVSQIPSGYGIVINFSIIIETINRLEDENLQYLNISYPNFHQPTQLHWGLDFP